MAENGVLCFCSQLHLLLQEGAVSKPVGLELEAEALHCFLSAGLVLCTEAERGGRGGGHTALQPRDMICGADAQIQGWGQ